MRLYILILMLIIAGCLLGPFEEERTVQTEYGNLTFDFSEKKFENARESGKPTLLEFSAEWCPACYEAIPVVEELRGKYGDELNIMTVNYDEHSDLARGFGVASLPSFVFFDRDGTPVKLIAGYENEKEIKGLIDGLL